MFELRPYQAEAKQAILAAWDEGYRKTLLVLPTGCGKTVVFSSVTENQVNKGHRVLIMAHRGELLDQAADKLKEASGLDSVLEKAESTSLGSFLPVTVGSVQSLAQEKRLARFPNNYFQDIIVDEAHHCLSDSYKRVLDHFPNANILGVTATPDRGRRSTAAATPPGCRRSPGRTRCCPWGSRRRWRSGPTLRCPRRAPSRR